MNKHYLKTAAGALLLSVSSVLFSQNVAINTSGNAAYLSAILDLSNDNIAGLTGFLPPYVALGTVATTFGLNGTAAQSGGIIVYNTNANLSGPGLYTWSTASSSWVFLGSGISGTGQTNYLARWSSPSVLSVGVSQDNGLEEVVAQGASPFGFSYMLTVVGAGVTETNAILGTASVTGGIGVTGGNSASSNTNAGVEGYIGTEAAPANAVGVYGVADAAGAQVAVEGKATGGTTNVGGYFTAGTTGTNYALLVPSGGGNVGFGTIAPQASAIVDFSNTNAGSSTAAPILWPENAAPATNITGAYEGEEIYNSTTGCFQFYHAGVWQTAGCPCAAAPPAQTITPGCTDPFGGETTTYSTTVGTGASYNWTAASNDGTPTISGAGTQTVTVTWPAHATTGTVTSALSNFCGSTTTNFTTTITADSMIGPSSIFTGTTSAGLYRAANGTAWAWTITAGGAGCTIVSPASQSTEVNTGTGSFTIQCVVTGAGTCTTTLTMPVTVAACAGTITVDPNPFSTATTTWTFTTGRFGGGRWTTSPSMSIQTTANNDLVVVVLTAQDGGNRFFNLNGQTPSGGTVSYQYNGGAGVAAAQWTGTTAATFYEAGTADVGAAPIDVFYFFAPTAGTYSITVTDPTWYTNNQEMNFAVALTGFCSAPTASDLIGYTWGYDIICSSGSTAIFSGPPAPGVTWGTAEPIGTYCLMAMNNIYVTADGAQYFVVSSGYTPGGTSFFPLQINYGQPGVTNCTASVGGCTFNAASTAPFEVEANDPNEFCTGEVVGLLIH